MRRAHATKANRCLGYTKGHLYGAFFYAFFLYYKAVLPVLSVLFGQAEVSVKTLRMLLPDARAVVLKWINSQRPNIEYCRASLALF